MKRLHQYTRANCDVIELGKSPTNQNDKICFKYKYLSGSNALATASDLGIVCIILFVESIDEYKLSLGFSSSILHYHVLTTFDIKLERVIKLSSNCSQGFSASLPAPLLLVIIPVASLNL